MSESTTAPARILRDLPVDTTSFAFSYKSANDPGDTSDFDPEKYGLGIIRLDKPDGPDGYRYAAIAIEPTGLYLREWKDDVLVAEHDAHIADSDPDTWYDILVEFSGTNDKVMAVSWGKSGAPLENILNGTLSDDLAIAADHVIGFGDGSAGGYEFKDVILRDTNDSSQTVEVEYKYDALGRRIQKVIDPGGSPTTINYYYSGSHVIEERDGADTVSATFVYGAMTDEVLSMTRDIDQYFYHTDDLGNIMAITDAAGDIAERYEYADYGGASVFDDTGSPIASTAIGNPLLFNGRRYDEETDLYYYRTRYMDPSAGRFITRDTIGQWGDTNNLGNGQAYVGNNPWSRTDPTGKQTTGDPTLEEFNPHNKPRYEEGVSRLDPIASGVMAATEVTTEDLHMALSSAGMFPGIGLVFDITNSAWYAVEGNTSAAVTELVAAAPGIGDAVKIGGSVLVIAGVTEVVVNGKKLRVYGELAETAKPKRTWWQWITGQKPPELVRYGPHDIGPLDKEVAMTFRSASYTERTTTEPLTLYRAYGGKGGNLSGYWTKDKPQGPLQARIDSALNPRWGNTAEHVSSITVPPGTKIYEGYTAPQRTNTGELVGGGSQVYIPNVDSKWLN